MPDRNGAKDTSGLELPHDRDESTSMTGGVPSEPMRQAHRDLARGLQDTDKGPVLDRTYQRLKKAG